MCELRVAGLLRARPGRDLDTESRLEDSRAIVCVIAVAMKKDGEYRRSMELLNGSDNYEIWKSRMKVLTNRKELGALLHFGDQYAYAMHDGEVDKFVGKEEEEYFEEFTPATGRGRGKGRKGGKGFQTPISRRSSISRKSLTTCIQIAKADNQKLYGLIVDNVEDNVLVRIQRTCEDDGLGAIDLLERSYSVKPKDRIKIRNLKAKFTTLKASDCKDFKDFMEQLMQAQSKLAKMDLAVDEDSIKTAIALQIPNEYENIVTTLEREEDERDIQGWIDEIQAHIDGVEEKKVIRGEATSRRPIAFQTASSSSIICQLCNEEGHSAKECKLLKRSGVGCRYCKQPDHELKDCPKAKAKDAARAKYGSSSSKDLRKAYQAALKREQECEAESDNENEEEEEEEIEIPVAGGLIGISDGIGGSRLKY